VVKSIPAGEIVSGITTMPHQTFLRTRFLIQRLPEMTKQLRALEDRVRLLEAEIIKERKKDYGTKS
jgi:UDP-3-O-[3-hydroxymyristoyl] glucosamine N-acyltransferase